MANGIIRTFLWRLIPARVPTGPQAGGGGREVFIWRGVKHVGEIVDDSGDPACESSYRRDSSVKGENVKS
jgi:hypothetical protein